MDFFSRHSPSFAEPGTLITFYEETSTDSRGRHLTDILRWGVNKLESSHDYIQTLFPLPERSGVNDRAPIIDRQVFEAFRSRTDLQERLRDAFKKMLWFYGFELKMDEEGKLVKRGHNYQIHCQNWLARFDHNHLRITRIIRCLRVLGLEDEALAFYNTIASAMVVSSRSRMYWGRAAHRPLNIRPDINDDDIGDERIGPKFLWEFEQAKKEREKEQIAQSGSANKQVAEDDVRQSVEAATEKEFATETVKEDETIQDPPDKKGESLGETEQLKADK